LILELGGRIALSDDAHGPHAVGLNYARMLRYLRAAGVRELWRLEGADSPNEAGRYVRAVRVDGEWWESAWVRERVKEGL
jgi:histidinol-phosphatase (PHP family)